MRIVQKKGVQKLLLRKRQLKQKQAGSASSAAAFEFVSATGVTSQSAIT